MNCICAVTKMCIRDSNYGARQRKRIMDTIRLGIIMSTAIMALGLVIFQLFPEQLPVSYTHLDVYKRQAQKDVFVGGDCCTGPKFAIDAIAAGKQGDVYKRQPMSSCVPFAVRCRRILPNPPPLRSSRHCTPLGWSIAR